MSPGSDDAAFAALLLAERSALREGIRNLGGDVAEVVAAAEGSNADDEHDPEGATIAFERARLSTSLADAERALAAVERALERLAVGRYGTCQRCGKVIAEERLLALPATERCITCAGVPPGR